MGIAKLLVRHRKRDVQETCLHIKVFRILREFGLQLLLAKTLGWLSLVRESESQLPAES